MGTIQLKRGLQANFPSVTLLAGEPCFTLDQGNFYIGNGTDKILINNPNADTAKKLLNSRLIAITGDGTGSSSFDGSVNTSINLILADTGVTEGTYTKVTVDSKGRITSATNLTANDIPNLTLSKITDVGTVASKDFGEEIGQVPVIQSNGKLSENILPALAITDTFVVNSQTAMLALVAQVGDIAIRTDINKTFILKSLPSNTLANWQELLTPISPVQSVNGKTGIVTITANDVGLGNVTNESKATMFTSPTFTGTPTSPTPATADNTNKLATTSFVKAQGYLTASSNIDGGTF